MRNFGKNQNDEIRLTAISGHSVVFLGFDLNEHLINGLLGFSIQRIDHSDHDKTVFLESIKVFGSVIPEKKDSSLVSTENHPIQDFSWSDFTVKFNNEYTYIVEAKGGQPSNLKSLAKVAVRIKTESTTNNVKHKIFFNRGVAGSQAFSRKFDPENKLSFNQIVASKPWVFDWLSRGLKEALFDFIKKAKDSNFKIRGSIYECSYEPLLLELKAAKQRGVDVQLIVHAHEDDPKKIVNIKKSISNTGISGFTTFREHTADISHNKFFVLIEKDNPIEVWTGSTNISTGGIFGHSNVGHQVKDKEVANKYFQYWEKLHEDPTPDSKIMITQNASITGDPNVGFMPKKNSMDVFFSPREKLRVLDWYSELVDSLGNFTFMTFPFGIDKRFEAILLKQRTNPIYIITDKVETKTPTGKGIDEAEIKQNKLNLYSYGDMIKNPNKMEKWLSERLSNLNSRVRYIHTKYILINPLSKDPIVISGSANFSENSIKNNDENSLVIRGNTTVADIYFVEFMRLFKHFYFRNLQNEIENSGLQVNQRVFLNENDTWAKEFYDNINVKSITRKYFCNENI
jgi:phosphatidylserine/phosphatidylglycerophosphate/cardiolipin synthase-like enzyme